MSLKNCNCHQLLTLISFQTCMTYFIFYFIFMYFEKCPYIGSQQAPKLLSTFVGQITYKYLLYA